MTAPNEYHILESFDSEKFKNHTDEVAPGNHQIAVQRLGRLAGKYSFYARKG